VRAVAKDGKVTIHGPLPIEFLRILSKLSGRKVWNQSKSIRVEGSRWNINIIKNSGFPIEWEDKTDDIKGIEEIHQMLTDYGKKEIASIKHNYQPKLLLKKHQIDALNISCYRQVYAYFMEMGLGKTALTIANFCILYLDKKIDAVLILAPKGAHKQWIAEEIPKHIDPSISLNMTLWSSGKYYLSEDLKVAGKLNIFALNIDSVNTEAGRFAIVQFMRLFGAKFDIEINKKGERKYILKAKGRLMMIVDESHQIGNWDTKRTQEIFDLGKLIQYKRILTGTPIATNLTNIWCQFMFLDPRIIGINYITAFKSHFCEVGGYTGYEVVGEKNVEEFYSLIAPHNFRITKKECLDLPEKIYAKKLYTLGNGTRAHYENMKNAFMTQLNSGEIVEAMNALAALVRLQQICSGFLPQKNENGEVISKDVFSYERAEIALDIVNQVEGPVIIWARFIQDIVSLKHVFKEKYSNQIVTIDQIDAFKHGHARLAFLNPASGGVALNLQESGCQTMIYLNNSFNLIHRQQSEDRVHRMGMVGALTIFDIVADKTIDDKIAENLKAKRDLASFVLDEIRQILE
jgi:SNF2 family DNA or RNA helicase